MNFVIYFAIFIFATLSFTTKALASYEQLSSDEKKSWNKLMHYNTEGKIQIYDARFYLTTLQNHRPDLEYSANILSFNENKISFSCEFPARAKLISQLINQPYIPCEMVEKWKKELAADSISLVYVSQYIRNPASVFGHSFILIQNSKKPVGLHNTLNNAANMPENISSFDYIYKGLSGGFKSTNFIEPLYIKNQEYSLIENRDMWLFELDLNNNEIGQYLNHIWELDHKTSESYYFLTQNCSSYLVNSLAAVVKDIEPVNNSLYFMPIESIKRLNHKIRSQKYIPSLRKKLEFHIGLMSEDQRSNFYESIDTDAAPINQVQVLDSLIDYYDFKKTQQAGILNEEQQLKYDNILLQRSKVTLASNDSAIINSTSPVNSFGASRLSIGVHQQKSKLNTYLSVAPFYHSILQKHAGYIPFSEIIFLDTQFEIETKRIKKVNVIQLANHPVHQRFDPNLSWTGSLFLDSTTLDESYYLGFNLNIGKTYQIQDMLTYLMWGPTLNENDTLSYLTDLGILYNTKNMRTRFSIEHRYNLNQISNLSIILQINTDFSSNHDIEFKTKYDQYSYINEISINYFF